MKPIKFKGHNLVLAENQPEYQALPVCNECRPDGSMTSCWKLSWRERLRVLFTGKLFFTQLTFGNPFQPISPSTTWQEPTCKNCGGPIGEHKHKNK